MKQWAVVGRTFSAQSFDTEEEAREFVSSLPSKVIEYDSEIMLYKRNEFGGYEKIEEY